jgi:Holliday junction resolvase-like predicted endonuclease
MFFKRKSPKIRTGERGERAARWYLLLHGYRILERNYLCHLGEIDITAVSITDMKLAHIMDAARYFLLVRGKGESFCRFDIISVRSGGPYRDRIRHYKDAFWTTDERPTRGLRLKAWIRRQPRIPKNQKPFDAGTGGHGGTEKLK